MIDCSGNWVSTLRIASQIALLKRLVHTLTGFDILCRLHVRVRERSGTTREGLRLLNRELAHVPGDPLYDRNPVGRTVGRQVLPVVAELAVPVTEVVCHVVRLPAVLTYGVCYWSARAHRAPLPLPGDLLGLDHLTGHRGFNEGPDGEAPLAIAIGPPLSSLPLLPSHVIPHLSVPSAWVHLLPAGRAPSRQAYVATPVDRGGPEIVLNAMSLGRQRSSSVISGSPTGSSGFDVARF